MKNFSLILMLLLLLLFTNSCELIFTDVDHLNYFTAENPRWINESEFNIVLYADYYDYVPCKVFRINPYENTCKEILYHDELLYNPQRIGKYYSIQSYESLYVIETETDEISTIEAHGDYCFIDSNAEYTYEVDFDVINKRTLSDSLVDSLGQNYSGLYYVDWQRERFICFRNDTFFEVIKGDSITDSEVIMTYDLLENYGIEDWYQNTSYYKTIYISRDVFYNDRVNVQFQGDPAGLRLGLQLDSESDNWNIINEISEDSINRNISGDFVTTNGLEVVVKSNTGEIFFKKTFTREGE